MRWPNTPPAWLTPWLIWRFEGRPAGKRPKAAPYPIPAWAMCFLAWCSWRRAGKRGARPTCAPIPIPMWSYTVLKAVNKAVPVVPPAPPQSFFTATSGAWFTVPGGQSERGADMKAAGMSWGMLNIADGNGWDAWATTIQNFAANGITIAVGGRVANQPVSYLMGVAMEHDVACFLDIEDEFKTIAPAQFEQQIQAELAKDPSYDKDVVINPVGWLYNDVDFTAIAHRPALLQIYPTDMKIPDAATMASTTADCIQHAKTKGFSDIGVMFEATDHVSDPAYWYSFWRGKPRAYFTGDWIGAHLAWPAWAVSA